MRSLKGRESNDSHIETTYVCESGHKRSQSDARLISIEEIHQL